MYHYFYCQNYIGALIGACGIPVTSISMLEIEIRALCEDIYWAANRLIDQYIMVVGDAQNVLILFKKYNDYAYHPYFSMPIYLEVVLRIFLSNVFRGRGTYMLIMW